MRLLKAIGDDPLLFVTSLLLQLIGGFLLLMTLGLIIAFVAVGAAWDQVILPELLKNYPAAQLEGLFPRIMGCAGLGTLMAVFAHSFIRKLHQMVRTVSVGDPFEIQNSARLEHMAWMTLAIQFVGLIMGGWIYQISKLLGDKDLHFEFGVEGFLTVFLLFILARVFRRGAEMRADLEGTV